MRQWAFVCFLGCFTDFGLSQDVPESTSNILKDGEKKMSEHILKILEHFKQPDSEGIPGLNISEPVHLPDMVETILLSKEIYFENMTLYGLSKLQIISFNIALESMEVNAEVLVKKLQAHGNYKVDGGWLLDWLSGLFTVDIIQLKVTARGTLGVKENGKLYVQDIQLDANPGEVKLNIHDTWINSFIGTFNVINLVKPKILKEAHTKARVEIEKRLEEVVGDMRLVNSVSPLDVAIAEIRNTLRQNDMEPYRIQDQNASLNLLSIELSHMLVTGLTSFYRVGNITLKIEDNTVIADFEVGTQKLEGTTDWTVTAVGGFMSRSGSFSFSIEYINGRFILAQPMDTRLTPQLKHIKLEIGNIQVLFNGAGTIDYLIEFAANILPNLLRSQIINGLEQPIKENLQLSLNSINVEERIKEMLSKVDKIQKTGLILSTAEIKTIDDDSFFNF